MFKKISFLLFLVSLPMFSQQKEIPSYQFIIVKDQFSFVKKDDQYQTSSLTQFLLKKKGFQVFLSNESLPQDLINNKCLGLIADVIDNSTMFITKSKIVLRDCSGKIVYESKEGRSKEKNYKKAYHESIRNAYNTMIDFVYSPSSVTLITQELSDSNLNKSNVEKIGTSVLYAQAIDNGYQLVNLKPEKLFVILKTENKNLFILKNKKGVFYKKDDFWFAEYYLNNQLVKEKYTVKF